jgi:transposase
MSTAAPLTAPVGSAHVALPSLEHLPDDLVTLKQMIVELVVTLREERRDKQALRDRVERLLQRIYGRRTERFDPNQPSLFDDVVETQTQDAAEPKPTPAQSPAKPKKRARPHGRRRLPADMERRAVHHELTEAERLCLGCGQRRVDIGVDKSEQLDYRPASLVVIEHIIHKYLCPCCSKATAPTTEPLRPEPVQQPPGQQTEQASATPAADEQLSMSNPRADQGSNPPQPTPPSPPATPPTEVVVAAKKPTMPIPKGLPGAGLLAHLIVSKYVDHLPLYRLQRVYERQGLVLPRSTTCDWLAASAQLLRPLYDAMVALVLQSRVLHTDDTPVKMQEPITRQLATSRLWAYLGDNTHPCNVFDFTLTRKRDGPQQFLANFQGYLQADAFSGYDGLYLPQGPDRVVRIIEVACNAHARRKFYEARASDVLRAHQALAYYGQLYELERAAKGYEAAILLQIRQDIAVPILNKFRAWLDQQQADVLPKSPLAEAINYALNNWTALVRYTESGLLAIDNNVAEREMKRIAIGRKNWLFFGSEQGGKTAAILFSFTSTCQRQGVEPWAYLQDVLTRLPSTAPDKLAELLPHRWQAARLATTATPSAAAATSSTAPSGEPAS